MEAADLSVGAGGVSTWERMCVGLPSVIVSIAENQRPACEALADSKLIAYAGHHSAVGAGELSATLRSVLSRPELLVQMSIQDQLLVDGLGVARIVELLYPTPEHLLRLRTANTSDSYQYLFWANDPSVRSQSIRMRSIPFRDHQTWFAAKLSSTDSFLFVLEAGTLPVGQIRFDLSGDQARIDYSIDRLFRGRGWALRLVTLGIAQFSARAGIVFRAEVKESNSASRAVFGRLGFAESTEEHSGGLRIFRFDASKQALRGEVNANTD